MSGAVDVAVAFARRKRSSSAPVAVIIQKSPKFTAALPPPPSLLCFEVLNRDKIPELSSAAAKDASKIKDRRRSASPLGMHQRLPNSTDEKKKKKQGAPVREFVVVIGRERTASPSPVRDQKLISGNVVPEAAVAVGGVVARTRMRSSSRHRNSGSPVARLFIEKKMSDAAAASADSNIDATTREDARIAAMRKLASGAGYELGDRLGAGGFSEVWTVWQKWGSEAARGDRPRQKYAGKFFVCSDPDEIRRYMISEHYARELRAQHLLAEYRRRHSLGAEKKEKMPYFGMTGLYDYFQTPLGAEPDVRCVVVSLAAGGDLIDGLNCRKCLDEQECRAMARNLFSALAAIHECRLVHADVKPDNVYLLDKNDITRVALGDFGLAEETPDDDPEMPLAIREKFRNATEDEDEDDDLSTDGSESLRDMIFKDENDGETASDPDRFSRRGTLDYMSPEVVHGDMFPTYESDVWGAGLTCLMAIIGRNPFSITKYLKYTASDIVGYMAILHGNGPDIIQWELKKRGMSPEAERFFADVLSLSPYDRPSAKECLESDWLSHQ